MVVPDARRGRLQTLWRACRRGVQSFAQQVLARRGRYKVLEGPDDFDRHLLIRFPSAEDAIAYCNSPRYQEAAAIRQAASGRCGLVVTAGLD